MKLEDIDRSSHPFKVPEGYFDDLGEAIAVKTRSNDASTVLWVWLLSYKWQLSSVALVSCCLLVFLLLPSQEINHDLLADISDEEIMTYLASYELNETEILGDLTSSDVDALFESEGLLNDIDVQQESIDEVLLEHGLIDEIVEI